VILPLDPDDPTDRLALALKDARPRIIVAKDEAQRSAAARAAAVSGCVLPSRVGPLGEGENESAGESEMPQDREGGRGGFERDINWQRKFRDITCITSRNLPEPKIVLVEELLKARPSGETAAAAAADQGEIAGKDEEEEKGEISHIYFTSGSSGAPKGCIVSHGALLAYCQARNSEYGIAPGHVCLVVSPHTSVHPPRTLSHKCC